MRIRGVMVLVGLLAPGLIQAGGCNNWLKVNNVANLIFDGSQVVVHASAMQKGYPNFSWTNFPGNANFIIASSVSEEIKKRWVSTIELNMVTNVAVYFQLTQLDPNNIYNYGIEKVSYGDVHVGLDCTTYVYPPIINKN